MSTLTTPCEEIFYIPDAPVPERAARSRWRAVAWVAVTCVAAPLAWAAWSGITHAVRASWRSQCADNLRSLGLALLQYQEAHGQFPAPALVGRDGAKLLSWRVAILPQMGYQSLYDRFHLDEPWDSPHNRSLLAEMPRQFACPGGSGQRAGKTGYLVIVGPETDAYSINTPFEPTRGADIRHITDGTSQTILVFETDVMVPWTKPDDLQWVKGGPLPRVASPHAGGTNVVLADGATRFISATIDPNTLMAILTINGGEVVAGRG